MMSNGFNNLNDLIKAIEKEIKPQQSYKLDELLTDSFLKGNTQFTSLEHMEELLPFDMSSNEAFDKIPQTDLDNFINQYTNFSTWEDMMKSAAVQVINEKIQNI